MKNLLYIRSFIKLGLESNNCFLHIKAISVGKQSRQEHSEFQAGEGCGQKSVQKVKYALYPMSGLPLLLHSRSHIDYF